MISLGAKISINKQNSTKAIAGIRRMKIKQKFAKNETNKNNTQNKSPKSQNIISLILPSVAEVAVPAPELAQQWPEVNNDSWPAFGNEWKRMLRVSYPHDDLHESSAATTEAYQRHKKYK